MPEKPDLSQPVDVSRTPHAYLKTCQMPLFVFDLESIPDLELIRKAVLPAMKWENVPEDQLEEYKGRYDAGLTNRDMVQLAQWHYKKDFLPHMYHKVLCVGCLIVSGNGSVHKEVIYDKDEKTVINNFAKLFNRCRPYPRMVSWNGKSFDMPVLGLRMLKYGIKLPVLWEKGENCKDFSYNRTYTNRYDTTKHLDLSDHLVQMAYAAKPSLNLTAHFLDVPTKTEGMCGGDVMDYHYDGRDKEICDYCMQDVVVTYHVYLKFLQSSTFITQDDYNKRVAAI